MKLLWATDLHLNQTSHADRHRFMGTLRTAEFDAVVITGDISTSRFLRHHLLELGRACDPKPVYFVLGNHDFFGSSFADVDESVAEVCSRQKNLKHLGCGEIIPLSNNEALIGHRGWSDGLAGYGFRSWIRQHDFRAIGDFDGKSKLERFNRLESLGEASGDYIKKILPKALEKFDRVTIATHVPPYPAAALFGGTRCGLQFLPHFTNVAAGKAIYDVALKNRNKKLAVLCGHTHCNAKLQFSPNISVTAGAAYPGRPGVQGGCWIYLKANCAVLNDRAIKAGG